MNFEYQQFLNEQILLHLPSTFSKVGNKYNGRCFLCGDSAKSSRKKRGWFYPKTSSYFCFNCGCSLSGMKMLEILSGDSYANIKKQYAKLFLKYGQNSTLSGNTDSTGLNIFKFLPIVKPEWKKPLTEKALKYLQDRLVIDAPFFNHEIYSTFGKNNDEYILIPWQINGIDAYYQLNDFLKLHNLKYIFPKNRQKLVAGLDNIDINFPYVIVFEGFYDSLFVKNGVCVGTKAITDYQVDLIRERYPNHLICISFDNDKSGLESMARMLRKDNDFKYFKWFSSHTDQKDINDYILSKNDVNIFSDDNVVKDMIVDKLTMKMFLIRHHNWTLSKNQEYKLVSNDTSSFWKKRQI